MANRRKRNMRQFGVVLTTAVWLSPRAIRQGMSRAFAESIFPATTPERVAEHVAFNMIVNGIPLSSIDGFANLPDSDAGLERGTVDDVCELAVAKPKRAMKGRRQ